LLGFIYSLPKFSWEKSFGFIYSLPQLSCDSLTTKLRDIHPVHHTASVANQRSAVCRRGVLCRTLVTADLTTKLSAIHLIHLIAFMANFDRRRKIYRREMDEGVLCRRSTMADPEERWRVERHYRRAHQYNLQLPECPFPLNINFRS
jgi:hypothetical protein